jgi:hypothetical protein
MGLFLLQPFYPGSSFACKESGAAADAALAHCIAGHNSKGFLKKGFLLLPVFRLIV